MSAEVNKIDDNVAENIPTIEENRPDEIEPMKPSDADEVNEMEIDETVKDTVDEVSTKDESPLEPDTDIKKMETSISDTLPTEIMEISNAESEPAAIPLEEASSERVVEKRTIDALSDVEEDFAGFEEVNGAHLNRFKKIKEEPLSDDGAGDHTLDSSDSKSPAKPITTTTPANPISVNSNKSNSINVSQNVNDPAVKRPFDYGWKRELVYRAQMDKSKDKGDVYYITPSGKKLRTRNEILHHLHDDLTLANFTFVKEPIGMTPEQEIIRSAKLQTPTVRRSNPIDTVPDPTLGIGKRIPKPKAPKGASPPPPNRSISRDPYSGARRSLSGGYNENKSTKQSKPLTKSTNQHCSIECVLAMGMIPQLRCKKCLCLFHHECVGLDVYDSTSVMNYICENCVTKSTPLQEQNLTADSSVGTKTNGSTAIEPTQPIAVNEIVNKPSTKSKTIRTGDSSKKAKQNGRNELIHKKTDVPPQKIAIVGGRKFIVIQKPNTLNVTAPIDNKPETISNNGNTVSVSIDGVPIKGLGTSRSGTPSRVSSPHGTASPKIGSPRQVRSERLSLSTNRPSDAINFFHYASLGHGVLLRTFKYLKVQELLRAACVCRMWNEVANHSSLWQTVRMKNSQVNDWLSFSRKLNRNGTKHLDLRKMLISGDPSEMWLNFSNNIGKVCELDTIDMCKCSTSIVEKLFTSNNTLRVLNAVTLQDSNINLDNIVNMSQLEELRLKSSSGLQLESTLQPLESITVLKHLSLVGIKDLHNKSVVIIENLVNLVSLELGECVDFPPEFGNTVLPKLQKLERLRLEKGQQNCCTSELIEAIANLPKLNHLELINFDIKSGFDDRIQNCTNLKHLLLIPTYISQSATTNHVMLNGIPKLKDTLKTFTWVVTQELLRVTELYVDQGESKKKDKKSPDECIPVMKPVPGMTEDERLNQKVISDLVQVDVLTLTTIDRIVKKQMPQTKFNILKVNYNATWRQFLSPDN